MIIVKSNAAFSEAYVDGSDLAVLLGGEQAGICADFVFFNLHTFEKRCCSRLNPVSVQYQHTPEKRGCYSTYSNRKSPCIGKRA